MSCSVSMLRHPARMLVNQDSAGIQTEGQKSVPLHEPKLLGRGGRGNGKESRPAGRAVSNPEG